MSTRGGYHGAKLLAQPCQLIIVENSTIPSNEALALRVRDGGQNRSTVRSISLWCGFVEFGVNMRRRLTTANITSLAACLLGITSVGVSVAYAVYSRDEIILTYKQRLASNSAVVAAFTSDLFGDADRINLLMATELGKGALSTTDPAAIQRDLTLLSTGTPGVSGMFVLNEYGAAVATMLGTIKPGQSFADRPYFYEQMYGPRTMPFFQPTTYSKASNQWRMYLSRAIVNAVSEKQGVVGVAINPELLMRTYSHVSTVPGSVVVLVDEHFRVMARYPADESLYGVSLERAPIFQRLAGSVEDAVSSVAIGIIDGRERLAVARRVADQPLSIAISVPVDEILGPWQVRSTAVVATGAMLGLVLLSGGWMLGRRQVEQDDAVQQIEGVLGAAPAGIAILDPAGQFVRRNDHWMKFAQSLGVQRPAQLSLTAFLADLRARGLLDIEPEHIEWPRSSFADFDIKASDGSRTTSFKIVVRQATQDADRLRPHSIAIVIDNTEHERLEALLRGQLTTDVTTGLRNRRGLIEAIKAPLASDEVTGALYVCEVLGVDELIASRGFDDGEQLIEAIAGRLRQLEASGAVVARLQGYSFSVFQTVRGGDRIVDVASLRRMLEGEYRLEGRTNFIRMAIGGAEQRGEPAHRLLHCAEIALGRAKRTGTAKTIFFNPELEVASRERVELSEALQRAVLDRQFVLYYQPKVSLETGAPVALEALIRWRHPIFGLQGPGLFMSLAEATGMIVDIGDWVIEEVCRQQAAWRSQGHRLVPIAINVSPVQFDHRNIVEQLSAKLVENDLERSYVTIEVTETTISDNTEDMLAAIRSLRTAGIGVALDDFGSGYSSLGAIAEMSIDEIKIDRSFIENIHTDAISQQIVEAIVAIGRTLNLSVTAEGVETEQQRLALLEAGCLFAQGYLFHRPMPARDVQAILDAADRGE